MSLSVDVGYILGHQDEYEELRYSLRSLRFFPHRKVWIAGASPPDWCQDVEWVPVDQLPLDRRQPNNQWWAHRKTNMRSNILALCDHPAVTDRFLYMNDDFLLVHPVGDELPPLPSLGSFVESHRGQIESKEGPYPDLYRWLVDRGVANPIHVSEHVPMLVDGRLSDWMREVWHITGFPVASLWGNLADVPTVTAGDWVLNHERDHAEAWPEDWWSISTVSRSFQEWPVGEKLRALFPDPSPYERN